MYLLGSASTRRTNTRSASILAGSILAGSILAGSILAGSILAGSILAGNILSGRRRRQWQINLRHSAKSVMTFVTESGDFTQLPRGVSLPPRQMARA